jgi:hypothetical protein
LGRTSAARAERNSAPRQRQTAKPDKAEFVVCESTIYERLTGWRREGLFDRILDRLRLKLNAEGLIDLDLWCIDSTSIRASRSAAGARKRGIRRNPRIMRSASRAGASAARSTW